MLEDTVNTEEIITEYWITSQTLSQTTPLKTMSWLRLLFFVLITFAVMTMMTTPGTLSQSIQTIHSDHLPHTPASPMHSIRTFSLINDIDEFDQEDEVEQDTPSIITRALTFIQHTLHRPTT